MNTDDVNNNKDIGHCPYHRINLKQCIECCISTRFTETVGICRAKWFPYERYIYIKLAIQSKFISFKFDAHNSIIQLTCILRESVNIKRKLSTRDYSIVEDI